MKKSFKMVETMNNINNKNRKVKVSPPSFIIIYAIALLMTSYMLIMNTFFVAYINGINTGNYVVTVRINDYKEAHVEAVMLLLGMPAIIYLLYSRKFLELN